LGRPLKPPLRKGGVFNLGSLWRPVKYYLTSYGIGMRSLARFCIRGGVAGSPKISEKYLVYNFLPKSCFYSLHLHLLMRPLVLSKNGSPP